MSFLGLALVGSAWAQTPPDASPSGNPARPSTPPPARTVPAPVPVGADPSATTAAFGDWILRCVRTGEAAAQKTCEIVQSIVAEGQTAPLAQIAVGRTSAKDALRFTLVLPNNVAIAPPPRVMAGEADKQPVDLVWQRCLPGGCFADTAVKDETLIKWRAATGMGRIAFADGGGRNLAIPFSFRGMSQALDALAKN